MQEWVISADAAGTRLDLWLARHAGAGSRSRAAAWLDRGKVFLSGKAAVPAEKKADKGPCLHCGTPGEVR